MKLNVMWRHLLLTIAVISSLRAEIREEQYHGWPATVLSNGKVEVVVVPAIGRVMQFRFEGESDGPFWENRDLDGKSVDPKASEWGNFGGDKSWPSPQGDWGKVTGRGWPPPAAFDSIPASIKKDGDQIILSTEADAHFGIPTERIITLEKFKPEMRIVTTYEKMSGDPINAGIWIITQLKDPVLVSMPLPEPSIFPAGYNKQSDDLPQDLKRVGNLVTCTRSKTKSTKIGSDAEKLIWENQKWKVTIESPRIPNAKYPDQNSSAEIYTNPDPKSYVELELLGPLHHLKPGDRISQTNIYTLERVK